MFSPFVFAKCANCMKYLKRKMTKVAYYRTANTIKILFDTTYVIILLHYL